MWPWGGTLIQDLGDALRPFHQGERDLWHPICTAPGSLLHRLWGSRILINSAHHQAADRLGDGLRRTAWSEGGVTEAVEHSCLPVAAVQFHPEQAGPDRGGHGGRGALFRWLTARGGRLTEHHLKHERDKRAAARGVPMRRFDLTGRTLAGLLAWG